MFHAWLELSIVSLPHFSNLRGSFAPEKVTHLLVPPTWKWQNCEVLLLLGQLQLRFHCKVGNSLS